MNGLLADSICAALKEGASAGPAGSSEKTFYISALVTSRCRFLMWWTVPAPDNESRYKKAASGKELKKMGRLPYDKQHGLAYHIYEALCGAKLVSAVGATTGCSIST